MKLDLNNLPDDPSLLQKLVKDLAHSLDAQQQETKDQKKIVRVERREVKALNILVKELKAQLAALNRARYGRRSEKLSPDQLALFEAELDENIAETKAKLDALLPEGRNLDEAADDEPDLAVPIEDNLEHETVSITLSEPQCQTCGTDLVDMGTEERELLDYVPAKFLLKKIIRQKCSCPRCETVVTAPLPCLPIEKGRPGPNMLAHVLVSIYQSK